jgi:hypothetical protein
LQTAFHIDAWPIDGRPPRCCTPLPPRSPELNSQENIWQFMRQNGPSNRIIKSFDDIFDHCHEAVVEGADAEAIPRRLCSLDVERTPSFTLQLWSSLSAPL